MKGFSGFGRCCRCGDTNGPWSWYDGIGWLCDLCADEADEWAYDEQEDEEEEDDD